MATLDDAEMLGRWIRRTFVTCDDTGLSEEVLEGEGDLFSDNSSTESSSPTPSQPAHSPDITVQREKKFKGLAEQERRDDNATTVTAIISLNGQIDFNDGHDMRKRTDKSNGEIDGNGGKNGGDGEEISGGTRGEYVNNGKKMVETRGEEENSEKAELLGDNGGEKFVGKNGEKGGNIRKGVLMRGAGGKGGLMAMMEEHDRLVKSCPWGGYSKLEAPPYSGVKSFTIHPTMTTTTPITLTTTTPPFVVSLATVDDVMVVDFVGLVCWRYYVQDIKPTLRKSNPNDYDLLMVDSGGMVDWDLPPLDHHQPIQKFAFKHLALVEKEMVAENLQEFNNGLRKSSDLRRSKNLREFKNLLEI